LLALFTLIASFLSVRGLHAQDQEKLQQLKNATPEQRAEFQTNMMKSKLNLEGPQLAQVSAINLKYAQLFQPIMKGDDSRFSKMRKAKALQAQKDKELQGVFTKDQYKLYEDFEQELRSKMMSVMKAQ
jgi:hypothetical protein